MRGERRATKFDPFSVAAVPATLRFITSNVYHTGLEERTMRS
jgi:hypothetical protein